MHTGYTEVFGDCSAKYEIVLHVGHISQPSLTQKSTHVVEAYLKNRQLLCFKVFGQHQNLKKRFQIPHLK